MRELWQAVRNLIVPLLAGLCLLLSGIALEEARVSSWVVVIVRDVGVALLVAFTLGVAVDLRLKQAIVIDVLRSALGYVLPKAVGGELLWVIEQHLVDTEYRRTYHLEIIDAEWLRLTESVHYNLTNQGHSIARFPLIFATDDWNAPLGPAEIEAKIYHPDGSVISYSGQHHGWHVRAEADIDLEPGATLQIWAQHVSYRRATDRETFTFVRPTINPEVTVEIPEGFAWELSPQHRTRFVAVAPNVRRLDGTCLPYQSIALRWWPMDRLSTEKT